MRWARVLAPAVAWMLLILWLGSDRGSAETTAGLILPVLRALFPGASPLQLDAMHAAIRKLAHVTEYAVLTVLWTRVFHDAPRMARGPAAGAAWAIAAIWAIVDESYQSTVASRTASAFDVAIDAFGALLVAVPSAFGVRPSVDLLTRLTLWVAAGGGVALIAVNVATGVRSGVLWLTVPLAIAALVLLRRFRP